MWSLFLAGVHAELNEREPAFAMLEQEIREGKILMPLINVHPWLDPLRTDPRFDQLLHRMSLPVASSTVPGKSRVGKVARAGGPGPTSGHASSPGSWETEVEILSAIYAPREKEPWVTQQKERGSWSLPLFQRWLQTPVYGVGTLLYSTLCT